MENEILLSIVIPVFNRATVLPTLLDSILAVRNDRLEVLLVNDGSTDESEAVCNSFVQKDRRCHLFNKENGGVSSARNVGIDHAKGKYLYFCDSDDSVVTETLEAALSLADAHEEDLLIFDFQYFLMKEHRIQKSSFTLPADQILQKNEIVHLLIEPLICKEATDLAGVWNKFFLAKTVKEASIRFEEKVSRGEDWRFILDFLDQSQTAYYIPQIIYTYYLDGSQTEQKYKRIPGIHLLGAQERKWRLCEKYGFTIFERTKEEQIKDVFSGIIFSAASQCNQKEFQIMLKSKTAQDAAKTLLLLAKQDRLSPEINKRHLIAARLILFKNSFLMHLFAKSHLGRTGF